jgi:tetratricopeptide (TPR) repeat protein
MDQPDKALASYEEVLKLEPRGFFNAISSADCLHREAHGEWPAGMCKAYAMVEWLPPSEKRKALEALVAKVPNLAAAWKDLAGHLDDPAASLQALDRGLAQRPDPQTRGFLLINKALSLDKLGKHDEARRILSALAAEPTLPVDVEQLAKLSLSQLVTKQ